MPVGEGRAADRAALAAMEPFQRRGSNLSAVYGAVADLGYLQWEPSLSGYRDHYRNNRRGGNIAYTVLSYRTPIAWVKVDNGYPERIHVPRNPRWSRTTNNHRATAAAALGVDRVLIDRHYANRYAFDDRVYELREVMFAAQREAERVAQAAARAEAAARRREENTAYQRWLSEMSASPRPSYTPPRVDPSALMIDLLERQENIQQQVRMERATYHQQQVRMGEATYHVSPMRWDATVRRVMPDGQIESTPLPTWGNGVWLDEVTQFTDDDEEDIND